MIAGSLRLVLVRHAESEWNAAGRWQGHAGSGLTVRGRAQAEATARYLARRERSVVLIARSDLPRVAETAAPAQARFGVQVVQDAALRELDVGEWAGLTHEQVVASDPDGYAAWQAGHDVARGGGETFAALRGRVTEALWRLADHVGQGTVLVFTHGGPVRVAVAEALGLPPGGERRVLGVRNASLTVLQRRDGQWALRAFNEAGHLDIVD